MGAREKYSARPSSAVTTFTTSGRSSMSGVAAAAHGAEREAAGRHGRRRRAHDFCTGEGLVTLDIYDRVVPRELRERGDFGDAIGAGGMVGSRQHGLAADLRDRLRDGGIVGGDDASIRDASAATRFADADDERHAAEEPERFAR